MIVFFFFFSSRRRHTRCSRDWSSDVCSSDLQAEQCLFNIRRRKSEKISELRCRSWTEMRHPAADHCQNRIVERGGSRFDFRQLWFKAGAWKQRSKASYSLGWDPIDATIKPGASGTILPEQSLKVGTPVCKICVGTAAGLIERSPTFSDRDIVG